MHIIVPWKTTLCEDCTMLFFAVVTYKYLPQNPQKGHTICQDYISIMQLYFKMFILKYFDGIDILAKI